MSIDFIGRRLLTFFLWLCSRVMSVTHSHLHRNLVATTSDDGTARLWAGPHLSQSVGVISMAIGSAITCADFSLSDPNALALASGDHQAYLYDLRRLDRPVKVCQSSNLDPVSYCCIDF
jgi:WD40 repeat protein